MQCYWYKYTVMLSYKNLHGMWVNMLNFLIKNNVFRLGGQ